MTKINPRQVLEDPRACKEAFDVELEVHNIIEGIHFQTYHAIRAGDEYVKIETKWLAAAVLVMQGKIPRPPYRPPKGKWWRRLERPDRINRLRARRREPVAPELVDMLNWVRRRMEEVQTEAAASGKRTSADDARFAAAGEAKEKFGSDLSENDIADRSRRPGRYRLKTTPPSERRY